MEDIIKGRWKQLKGKFKQKWGKLTDEDLTVADGHKDHLVGRLQERYGWAKERAAQEVREFEAGLDRRELEKETI